jgi:hypothetical protein
LRADGSGVTTLRRIRPLHATRFCVATATNCRSAPPWHHRTPSVPRAASTVRAAEHSCNHAVFRRESFTCLPAVEPGVSPGSNPPRLSAGRASRTATSSDVLCRPSSWRRAFQSRLLAARIPLQGRAATATRAKAVLPACRLRPAGFSTQNAFDWLHPSQAAGSGCPVVQLALFFRASGTPFHKPEPPARHGCGPPQPATSPRNLHRPEALPALREEGTCCQSLQPTCCQRAPAGSSKPRALGSHRSDHRFRPRYRPPVPSHALWQQHLVRWRRIAASGISDPEQCGGLAPTAPAVTMVDRSPAKGLPPSPVRAGHDLRWSSSDLAQAA